MLVRKWRRHSVAGSAYTSSSVIEHCSPGCAALQQGCRDVCAPCSPLALASPRQVLTDEEQGRDPEAGEHSHPQFVWEVKCSRCHGLGSLRSGGGGHGGRRGSGRRAPLATCALCLGVGYVRHASTAPDDTLEEAYMTLGRTGAASEQESPAAANDDARRKRKTLASGITAANIVGNLGRRGGKPQPPM